MELILDSSVLIASERRGEALEVLVLRMEALYGGGIEAGLSAVSVVELTHGIYRAQTSKHRERGRAFVDELCQDMVVYPVTLDIARPAGRIEGEQAAKASLSIPRIW